MEDKNTAPPQNNCGELAMMTSARRRTQLISLYFQMAHRGQQGAFAFLPPIPAIDGDRAMLLLLFSKFEVFKTLSQFSLE